MSDEEIKNAPWNNLSVKNTVILDIPYGGGEKVAKLLGLEKLLVRKRGIEIKREDKLINIAVFVSSPWERLVDFWEAQSEEHKSKNKFKDFIYDLVFDKNPLGFENQTDWAGGPYQFCNRHMSLTHGAAEFAKILNIEFPENEVIRARKNWRDYYDAESFDWVPSIASKDIHRFGLYKFY